MGGAAPERRSGAPVASTGGRAACAALRSHALGSPSGSNAASIAHARQAVKLMPMIRPLRCHTRRAPRAPGQAAARRGPELSDARAGVHQSAQPPNRSSRSASASVTERDKRLVPKICRTTGGKSGAGVDTLFCRRCWPLVRLGTRQWSARYRCPSACCYRCHGEQPGGCRSPVEDLPQSAISQPGV